VAPTVVCARTSLAVPPASNDARESAPCVRATASCHVVWRAQGSRHTSGATASRSTHRLYAAISGCGSDEAGDACASLQAPRLFRWQRSKAAGDAMVPVVSTGTRENSTRVDSRAAPATLRLHLDVSIPRQARNRYVA
jgi:transposase